MYAVQRVWGDDWLTLAALPTRAAALAVAACWEAGGPHPGYRVVAHDEADMTGLLGTVAPPAAVRAEIEGVRADLAAYLRAAGGG